MQTKNYYVYILASTRNGTLYIGISSNLVQRVYQHKNKLVKGFSQQYAINQLVYYEQTSSIHAAIQREKQLKKWKREWKIDLIETMNPQWEDLYFNLF